MDKFIHLLRAVGKRPGMYFGPIHNGNGKSISHLRTFLVGIQIGQHLHSAPNPLGAFTFWVCHHYQVLMGGHDAIGHILEQVGHDEAVAFEVYFELLEQYLEERERIGCDAIEARYLAYETMRLSHDI